MAGNKDTARQKQSALGATQSSKAKANPRKPKAHFRRRPRPNAFRFREVAGKTVAFIEMDWSAEFPCVEVAFDDRTAMLFELGARVTMEPMYSDWKTGNQRVLARWPQRQTGPL